MQRTIVARLTAAAALALACGGLISCEKMQEAVDQAKMEATKLQAQAEEELKKVQEQAEKEAQKLRDQASQSAPGTGPVAPEAISGGGFGAAVTPAPTTSAQPAPVNGAEVVARFLALQPAQRTDSNLAELAALDETSRNLVDRMELLGSPVTSQGLAQLPQLPRIKHLDLRQMKLTANDLAAVAKLSQLEELLLEYAGIDDQELEELRPLTQLKTLTLTQTQISDAGLPALQNMAALETLVLSETRVSGNEIAKLDCLPGLKHLGVSKTSFGAGAEKALRQMNELQVLHASACGMNDQLVAQIKGRGALRELDLSNSLQVTDRSAGQLGGCANLEILSLGTTQVGDPTLNAFRRMKALRELNLMQSRCTPAGVAALQKALPELKIKYP